MTRVARSRVLLGIFIPTGPTEAIRHSPTDSDPTLTYMWAKKSGPHNRFRVGHERSGKEKKVEKAKSLVAQGYKPTSNRVRVWSKEGEGSRAGKGERGDRHGGAAQGGVGRDSAGQDLRQAPRARGRLVFVVGLGRRALVGDGRREGQDLPHLRAREARALRPRRRQA